MTVRAVALKEDGTHPPSEGVLARFAEVRPIRSLKDLEKVKEERPDIVLMDLRMPHVDGKEAVEVLGQSRPAPMLVLFDSKMQPTILLKPLNSLGTLKATRPWPVAESVSDRSTVGSVAGLTASIHCRFWLEELGHLP
jgi:CheY-like chemotaxis protein